jgi:hypothetical protein
VTATGTGAFSHTGQTSIAAANDSLEAQFLQMCAKNMAYCQQLSLDMNATIQGTIESIETPAASALALTNSGNLGAGIPPHTASSAPGESVLGFLGHLAECVDSSLETAGAAGVGAVVIGVSTAGEGATFGTSRLSRSLWEMRWRSPA